MRRIKLPKSLTIEDLRIRRDIGQHDCDFDLAMACAIRIDAVKYGKVKTVKTKKQ